jgi:hypothetical protein
MIGEMMVLQPPARDRQAGKAMELPLEITYCMYVFLLFV